MDMRLFIILFFLIYLVLASEQTNTGTSDQTNSNTQNAGIVISTTDKAIEDFVTSLLSLNHSQCLRIQNQHGIISIDPFGQVHFRFHNIRLVENIRGTINISTVEGKGLKVVLSGFSVKVKANWFLRYKKVFIDIKDSDEGNFEVVDLKMQFVLVTGKDSDGLISLKADSCEGSLEHLDLSLGSGLKQWLYSSITSVFSFALKHPCMILKKALVYVKSLPFKFPISDHIYLDLSPTQTPQFSNGSIRLFLRGEFVSTNTSTQINHRTFQPVLSANLTSDRMFDVQVSKASIFSALQGLLPNGSMKILISQNDFPGRMKDHFRASCWTPICVGFPFMQLKFGYSDYFISVEVELDKIPQLGLGDNGVFLRVNDLSVSLNVTKDEENYQIVSFLLTTTFRATFEITNNARVQWNVEKKDFTVSKTTSHIGWVPDGVLSYFTESLIDLLLLPRINELGMVGWKSPLPPCFSFIQNHISYRRSSLNLETGLKFG